MIKLIIYVWLIGISLCIPYAYSKFWTNDFDSIVDYMVIILPMITIVLSSIGIYKEIKKGC